MSRLAAFLVVVATVVSTLLVGVRFRLQPDVAALLPERGDSAVLRRYVRGFGGGDLAVVLVRAPTAEEAATVSAAVARGLSGKPTVRRASDRIEVKGTLDPMLAWRHADARGRARLREALTPEGMRARLRETRAMLLAPGGGAAAEIIQADPLRLAQLAFEGSDIGSGVRTQPDGAFASDDGTARLVLAQGAGQALRGRDARAFVADVESVLAPLRREHPGVRLGLTGGHAIAAATEAMLTRDLTLSGSVAMLLASLAFVVTFRRVRALVAVMPPLVLGTLWTAGCATLFPGGLSAIAVAFMSVVVGVGVDTGVHVYAALLEGRGEGLAPREAAERARRLTTRPVLVAAGTAGAAFATLGISDISAVRQLGLLCAAGEVLTAIAIVVVTPAIGAWLERGPAPAPAPAGWTRPVAALTATRPRALLFALLSLAPIAAVALGAGPRLAESMVAIRPAKLEPLQVQAEVFEAFGGKKGQWVVLVADRDPETARARADRVAERLGGLAADVEAVDALTALAPAPATVAARLAERDALDLTRAADELAKALAEVGFAPDRFAAAVEGMRHPPGGAVPLEEIAKSGAGILLDRYLGADEGDALVAIYVRPREVPGATERIQAAIVETDAGAMLTGYSRLEATLRASLAHDLPRIGALAGVLVVAALAASLRRFHEVVLASLVVASEVATVLLAIRVLGVPLHAYSALVLPVLLGITVDEGMFLLYRAREAKGDVVAETLRREGPSVAATALTTAAGFGALGLCDFDGLRDLGLVGALGSSIGLVVALVVVPAGLRLAMGRRR